MMRQAKDYLIFPLDVPNKDEALRLARLLAGDVGLFKIGLELYLAEGPRIQQELANEAGIDKFFLDLKIYDIPATVLGALSTELHGVTFITIPSDLGPTGLKKIVAAKGGAFTILAVTVLTSTSAADLKALGYERQYWEDPTRLVVQRAIMAKEAGCHGVVCSGREVKAVKVACGSGFLAVSPGIRPAWSLVAGDDQSRIVTTGEAIASGADYLVVGRPIRQADRPVEAARRVVAEIAAALAGRRDG